MHVQDQQREALLVNRRLLQMSVIFTLLLAVVLARVIQLQIFEHDAHSRISENNRVLLRPVAPPRGIILDRRGRLLADNIPIHSLYLVREEIKDMRATLAELGELVDISASQIKAFHRRQRRNRRPFEPVLLKGLLSDVEHARVAVNLHRLSGVEVVPELARTYPQGALVAHAVGYVGRISENELERIDPVNYSGTRYIGKIGIERFYETKLHGTVGVETVEVNALGQILRYLERVDPRRGEDIRLHLDIELQRVARDGLVGRRGAVVAVEVETGGILTLVSSPDFDPNRMALGMSPDEFEALTTAEDQPLFNRALTGVYPPASTLKPFIAIAGLEAGTSDWRTTIRDKGMFTNPRLDRVYRDWKRRGHGKVNLRRALAVSCDTYFYQLGYRTGIGPIRSWLGRFGFGTRVGLDLFNESSGLLPGPEWKRRERDAKWVRGDTINLSVGQGFILSTPVQLAHATAMIANRGRWLPLHLAMRQEPADEPPPVALSDPKDWQRIHAAMERSVHHPEGTAFNIGRRSAYRIAGKTGTAQVLSLAEGQDYDELDLEERQRDHALFIGFAPRRAPRIAVAVIVENGGSGNLVAAPLAKAVMDAYMAAEAEPAKIVGGGGLR